MPMGLEAIRLSLDKLWQYLLVGAVEKVPERNAVCEFECRATTCDWDRAENCERRRLAPYCELPNQLPATPPPDWSGAADKPEPADDSVCVANVAETMVTRNSGASIRKVLVLGAKGSPPFKRTQVQFPDPEEVPAMLDLLAGALQRAGFEFRVIQNPSVPPTDIWIISPLHEGTSALLHCPATMAGKWQAAS